MNIICSFRRKIYRAADRKAGTLERKGGRDNLNSGKGLDSDRSSVAEENDFLRRCHKRDSDYWPSMHETDP